MLLSELVGTIVEFEVKEYKNNHRLRGRVDKVTNQGTALVEVEGEDGGLYEVTASAIFRVGITEET